MGGLIHVIEFKTRETVIDTVDRSKLNLAISKIGGNRNWIVENI